MLLLRWTANESILLFGCWCFVLIGIWGLFYPSGMIRLAQRTHSQLRDDDKSLFVYIRFIGALLVVLPLLAALALLYSR